MIGTILGYVALALVWVATSATITYLIVNRVTRERHRETVSAVRSSIKEFADNIEQEYITSPGQEKIRRLYADDAVVEEWILKDTRDSRIGNLDKAGSQFRSFIPPPSRSAPKPPKLSTDS